MSKRKDEHSGYIVTAVLVFAYLLCYCGRLAVAQCSLEGDFVAQQKSIGAVLKRDFPSLSVSYFLVQGESPGEIRQYIAEHGPLAPDSRRSTAVTLWRAKWKVGSMTDSRLDHVSCDLNVTLPVWQGSKEAKLAFGAKWCAYLQCIVAHERKHAVNFTEKCPGILSALQAERQKAWQSCQRGATNECIADIGNRVLEEIRANDIAIDDTRNPTCRWE